jgi:hypothetical protein
MIHRKGTSVAAGVLVAVVVVYAAQRHLLFAPRSSTAASVQQRFDESVSPALQAERNYLANLRRAFRDARNPEERRQVGVVLHAWVAQHPEVAAHTQGL